jgi:Ca2+:H+ antiporter
MAKHERNGVFGSEESDDEDLEDSLDVQAAIGGAADITVLSILGSSKIAFLLVCVPVAWCLHLLTEGTEVEPMYTFLANFGSIVPLAWLISESTEQLEKIVGPAIGVLLNSTFGNLVEIILSVQAIRKGMVKLVQSSLLGAMLMNLLLVTGVCFIIYGVQKHSGEYNTHSSSYSLSLMGVATLALIVPTELANTDEFSTALERVNLSLGVSILLAAMYVQWLAFNMFTHYRLFQKQKQKQGLLQHKGTITIPGEPCDFHEAVSDVSDEESGHLPCRVSVAMLLFCTVLVAFHCDFLVESIEPVTHKFKIKEAFMATVLLPLVGNASEIIAAISIASKGNIDLAMGVAIGSGVQISLLVVPIAVWLSYMWGVNFDLDFEVFQVKLLMASILVAALCLNDGQLNWLKGSMMVTAYTIIAAGFFFIHDEEFHSNGEASDIAHLAADVASLQKWVREHGGVVNVTSELITTSDPALV